MSSTFEQHKTVVDIGPRYENGSDHDYLAFAYYADSNVFPKTYSPMFMGFGWTSDIIGAVGKLLGDVEGGMLKPGARWISAEGYIRAWRKKIKQAIPLDAFLNSYPRFTIVTIMDKEKYDAWLPAQTADEMKKKPYDYERMMEYLEEEEIRTEHQQRWGKDYIDVKRIIRSPEDVRKALQFNRMASNARLAENWRPQLRGVGTY